MTETQRAAMQQALAFTMREFATVRDFKAARTMVHDALRAALAEPDLFHCPQCGGPADNGHDRSIPPSPYLCTKRMAEPEPVAWMVYTQDGQSAFVTDNPNDLVGAYRALPLYATPPARRPLTHPQIHELDWPDDVAFEDILEFARAIERAHGIGGNDE